MKHFVNIFKYTLFLSLIVTMVSCGGDDDGGGDDTDPLADQAELLVQGTATTNSAKLDGNDVEGLSWDGFTVTFTGTKDGGSYSTNATGNQLLVWPASGTWEFGNSTGTIVTRDGDTDMALSVGATSLELTFDVDTNSGGKVKVVDGEWVFKFDF